MIKRLKTEEQKRIERDLKTKIEKLEKLIQLLINKGIITDKESKEQ